MKQNAEKNKKLIKQYPFVANILLARMEPYDGLCGISVNDLSICVKKADGDLMFRRANNIGLGDKSFAFQVEGGRKDQIMRRGEYAFSIDKKGKIINRLNFPRNDEERRKSLDEVYAWWVLCQSKELNASGTGYLHFGCLWKQAKYIVWVTIEAWHVDTENDDQSESRFGQFRDRAVHITIYGEPNEGFEKLHENANVYENLRLDTRVMTRGVLNKDHDIINIDGMLYEMCILFQDEVYFNGMKTILDGGKFRGASGQFGSAKVLCAELCGYDRVMIEDNASYVTFQLRPDSKHMYVLGQQGTLPQIRNLVRTVVRMWREKPELREAFKPDKNVSVI
jgi:hypothetical protein